MIYFLQEHEFKKRYEEDSEIIISEFNTIDVFNKRLVEVLYPELENKINKFSKDSISKIDRLVYSFKTDKNTLNYGFYFKGNQNLFWENLFFTISCISESKSSNIKNIKIPISLFYSATNKIAPDKNFFTEIYEKLSSHSYIYYIYFVNIEEFIKFYSFFENHSNKSIDGKSEILLTLAPKNELTNPLFIKNTELGIGETNLSAAQECLNENLSLNKQENENTSVYDDYLMYINTKDFAPYFHWNYNSRLWDTAYYNSEVDEKHSNRGYWFPQGYIKYSTVKTYADKKKKKNLEHKFSNAFGYIYYNGDDIQRSEDLKNFIKSKMKEKKKSRTAIVNSINTNELECITKIRGYKRILKKSKSPDWTLEKLSSVIDKHKSRHCRKFIDRKLLFFIVFALDLNMSDTQILFELSNCYLDKEGSFIKEDKILCDLLKFQQLFPNLKYSISNMFIKRLASSQKIELLTDMGW